MVFGMGGTGIPGSKPRLARDIRDRAKGETREQKARTRILRHQMKRGLRKTHLRKTFEALFRRLERAKKVRRVSPIEQAQIMLACHEVYLGVTTHPLFAPKRLKQLTHESHGGLQVLTPQESRQAIERWKAHLPQIDQYLKSPHLIEK